jgi:tetratricopeptide (TPR) repeat protein
MMHKRILLSLLGLLLVSGMVAQAADDPLKETALALNRINGTTAMGKRLSELVKDEAGTKKLLVVAVKMVKEDKPRSLNYNACYLLAKAGQFLKDMDSSLVFYKACAEEATKLGSASKIIDVFDGMIDLYAANKKFDEAIQACQEFLDIQTDDPESPINLQKPFIMEKLILATARKGKTDEALKLTENLIEKDKGGWYFVHLKGTVLRNAERYGDAADAYLETLERLKKNNRLEEKIRDTFIKETRYVLSGVYVDLKQIDKGAEQLEILVKEDPDNPTFLNDLGFILADHDLRIDEAEKFIRKAIEKDRERRKKEDDLPKEEDVDNAAYLDSLGWVLYKKKDYKEAKKYLLDAIKQKEGKHSEIYDHLADVHIALGEKDDAIKMWKEALKLEDNGKRDELRRKIIEKKLADIEKK